MLLAWAEFAHLICLNEFFSFKDIFLNPTIDLCFINFVLNYRRNTFILNNLLVLYIISIYWIKLLECSDYLVFCYNRYLMTFLKCTLGCTEYQKIFKFWCLQAFLGQKICPKKKLENGFFSKIDVAIVGWCRSFKVDLALAQ